MLLSSKNKIAWINLRLKLTRIVSQNRFIVFILCFICVLTIWTQIPVNDPSEIDTHTTDIANNKNTKSILATSFIVIGDWGIVEETDENYYNKLKVASAMKQVQSQYNTSFVISVGDQYYDNGIHLQSPLTDLTKKESKDLNYWFINHFENVFDQSFRKWYLILGNHDMRGSAKAQFKYSNISLRWHMPYNYYFKDFHFSETDLFRVIFMDTSSIMCDSEDRHNLDSLESWSCDEAWYHSNNDKKSEFNEKDKDKFVARNVQINWIKNRIFEADQNKGIKYIFMVGHHCLWSNGPHGCPQNMGRIVRPLFELSHKIKTYFCGHNHGMEHFQWTMNDGLFNVHTFLSGAGACLHEMNGERCKFEQLIDEDKNDERNEKIELQKLAKQRGFMTFHFLTDNAGGDGGIIRVRFWDENADKIYEAVI